MTRRAFVAFIEKGRSGPGLINAGVYHLRKAALTGLRRIAAAFLVRAGLLGRYIDRIHLSAFPG
ncbi:hypothetical protein ACU4GD_15780 [Cupriavidus basilensis]